MMDLTQLANLGEFIGGVAVLVTLIYLAVQVHQNQRIAIADSEAQLTALMSSHTLQPAIHAGLGRIVELGYEAPDRLDEEEKRRFRWWLLHYYQTSEGLWRKHQKGLLSPEAWAGYERVFAGMWNAELVVAFWERDPVVGIFSDEFREYLFRLRDTSPSKWRIGLLDQDGSPP
jgi:hypothetical protein